MRFERGGSGGRHQSSGVVDVCRCGWGGGRDGLEAWRVSCVVCRVCCVAGTRSRKQSGNKAETEETEETGASSVEA